jgi:parallel beta-helix repeat protein
VALQVGVIGLMVFKEKECGDQVKNNRKSAWFVIVPFVLSLAVFVVNSNQAAAGNIYYVATYGNDSNSCDAAQDINAPKRNLMGTRGGIACMQTPGDKLLIREGSYAEIINNWTEPYSLPSGTDWDNAFTVAAYPGETVIILGISIATDDNLNLHLSYWIFDGLHAVNNIPGSAEAIGMQSPDHLRFINMEVTTGGRPHVPGTSDQCVGGGGHFIEFINVEVHDCGDPTVEPQPGSGYSGAAYGFYWGGSDSLFDHIKLHDTTGYGFHMYSEGCLTCPDRNTIRYSEIYNTGTLYDSDAILFASNGDGNQAYENIIRNNNGGIAIGYGASNTQIYNNTIYGNTYDGISNGSGWGPQPNRNAVIENNIVANNGGFGISNSAAGTPQGEPIGTVIQNNILFNNAWGEIFDTGVETVDLGNLTGDPEFVDPRANDFRLQSTSPAINAGATLGAPLY